MPRELKSAEEIRAEVQRRLDARIAQSWDPEDAGTVTVQLPHRLAEPDERGCNWGIRGVTGDQGYRKLAGIGVHEVMAVWNLA